MENKYLIRIYWPFIYSEWDIPVPPDDLCPVYASLNHFTIWDRIWRYLPSDITHLLEVDIIGVCLKFKEYPGVSISVWINNCAHFDSYYGYKEANHDIRNRLLEIITYEIAHAISRWENNLLREYQTKGDNHA